MVPLSRVLAGLILPHDHFETHLDSNCVTVDEDLETKKFQFAGKTLSQIWSELVIDKYPVKAECISPENSEINDEELLTKDAKCISQHVQTSQHFLQIVKCRNKECCSPSRSGIFKLFPEDTTFVPPPIPLEQKDEGVIAARAASEGNKHFASLFLLFYSLKDIVADELKIYDNIPYDRFCPTVQQSLKARTCSTCGKYFATLVMLNEHRKHLHGKPTLTPKIRPKRVADQRASEFMAIIARGEEEDAEWVSVDDLEGGPESMLQLICMERERDAAKEFFPDFNS